MKGSTGRMDNPDSNRIVVTSRTRDKREECKVEVSSITSLESLPSLYVCEFVVRTYINSPALVSADRHFGRVEGSVDEFTILQFEGMYQHHGWSHIYMIFVEDAMRCRETAQGEE